MARDKANRNARRKIEEARQSGAKELDLSTPFVGSKTWQLTELPESLCQLTQLQQLNVAGNQLTAPTGVTGPVHAVADIEPWR